MNSYTPLDYSDYYNSYEDYKNSDYALSSATNEYNPFVDSYESNEIDSYAYQNLQNHR